MLARYILSSKKITAICMLLKVWIHSPTDHHPSFTHVVVVYSSIQKGNDQAKQDQTCLCWANDFGICQPSFYCTIVSFFSKQKLSLFGYGVLCWGRVLSRWVSDYCLSLCNNSLHKNHFLYSITAETRQSLDGEWRTVLRCGGGGCSRIPSLVRNCISRSQTWK